MLSVTAVLDAGWRIALLASLMVPVLAWWRSRGIAIDTPPPSEAAAGHLPGVFWIAAATLFCMIVAEWCITAWGATFVEDAAGVSTNTAVALMSGYFGGVLAGRVLGSRLARRHDPARLLALALVVPSSGLRPSGPRRALCRRAGPDAARHIGLGNLYPMGVSLAVALAPSSRRWPAAVSWR